MDFRFLLTHAREALRGRQLEALLANKPEHHAPAWHVHGLLGHAYNVVEAAKQLCRELEEAEDIMAALVHDMAKIDQFPRALRFYDEHSDPAMAYHAHEMLSAQMAKPLLKEADYLAVANHQHSYSQAKVETIIRNLSSGKVPLKEVVGRWTRLCAADAVGKGWTPNQEAQRPQVADKLVAVAQAAEIDANDRVLKACCHAVRYWRPLNPNQLPNFAELK